MADSELTGADLRRMLRLDDKEYQAELAADLATFEGPLDGLSDSQQVGALADMMKKDQDAWRRLNGLSPRRA